MPEKGQKTPVEEFVKYKKHPELLKEEIYALRATDEEKEKLYSFMKQYGGVLDSQESLMYAVMLPFTNYSIDDSQAVRKTVAKKQIKKVAEEREKYFNTGKKLGTSEDILKYIWDIQAARQMGYS